MSRIILTTILLTLGLASGVWAASATVDVYVFIGDDRTPLSEVQIVAGDVSGATSFNGSVTLALDAGEQRLTLTHPDSFPSGLSGTVDLEPGMNQVFATVVTEGNRRLILEATPAQSLPAEKATLSGVVVDGESGAPVPGVQIVCAGLQQRSGTIGDGTYTFTIPAGDQRLFFIYPYYGTTVEDVDLAAGASQDLRVTLFPSAGDVVGAEVVTETEIGTVRGLLSERRDATSITDSIGSEEISAAGDGDAASALKRVTGLTVVGGKYVYVRGMGERYSQTLLNGSSLPSPEPERRVVPLDLFPTDMIDSLVVNKSYSADMPGEFGGGAIRIRTKDIPDDFFWDVSLSTGWRSNTTFQDGLTYDGGSSDWLGVDDGTRALPGAIEEASQGRFVDVGVYTDEQLEYFGEQMSNVWTPEETQIDPDVSFSTSVGDAFELFDRPAGFSFGISYGQSWNTTEQDYRVFRSNLTSKVDYDMFNTERAIDIGALLNFAIDIEDNQRLRFNAMAVRATSDEARVYEGPNEDFDEVIRISRLRWIENMLVSNQISGSHLFPGANYLSFDWRYSYAFASRYEPDRREIQYNLDEQLNTFLYSDNINSSQRLFSELDDGNHDFGASFGIPFKTRGAYDSLIKVGTNIILRDREVETRRFRFDQGRKTTGVAFRELPPEELIVPENIGGDGFTFQEITRTTDNYDADQTIYAGFAQVEMPVAATVTLTGGVRVEASEQNVRNFSLSIPFTEQEGTIDETSVLPSFGLAWRFADDMQLRFNYGRSLSRPDFREMSLAPFTDVVGGREVFGNPDLKVSYLDNFDIRWEFFPRETELFSVGVFYKNFTDPIEMVVRGSAQESLSYQNAEGAYNTGAEFEVRKSLDFLGETGRYFYLSGNLAYIYSRVRLAEQLAANQTNDERPLQGQSPFSVNLMLIFDQPVWGSQLSLVYNVVGERIAEVGAQGVPDMYEQPLHQLDFVYKQRFGERWRFSFKVTNILNQDLEYTQDDAVARSYKVGTRVTMGISASIF